MDKDQEKIASGNGGPAATCSPSPGPGCSSQFNGQLFDLPTDYYAVFSVRGKGKKAKTTFVCNVKARGKAHALKIARSHGLDLPPMSHAHFIGLAGYRESLSWAFPMMNPTLEHPPRFGGGSAPSGCWASESKGK